ncbi:hypothetical protein [Lysobacter antibioticus]|uniref:Uncharacterized protein n=1 Tax=Lysobacter antibioticus TaxID=84531 RepID=A0A0S2FCW8_LYSAN|nr:hypothetical protein [Lysobacter antibioticus]ALN81365.1 hypothetical protein LA76x_3238 [Lysobacter antibioticus]
MTDIPNNSPAGEVDIRNHVEAITVAAERAIAALHSVSGDAAGQVAQSATAYFDGVSKIALASQAVLMKQMTQDLVEQSLQQSAEDALSLLATDLLMGAAAAVAAAAGAMEAESAAFAIGRIDENIGKYSSMIRNRIL